MELLLHIYLPKVVRDTSIATMHPAASHAPCNAPYPYSYMPCRSDLRVEMVIQSPPKNKSAPELHGRGTSTCPQPCWFHTAGCGGSRGVERDHYS